jgi:hypothetical protein
VPGRTGRSQERAERLEAARTLGPRFQTAAAGQGSERADDGDRTRDPQLGKLMLYQLSYVRVALKIARRRAAS